MLNIKQVRNDPETMGEALSRKGNYSCKKLLELDTSRRELITKLNGLQQELNSISKEIPSSPDKEKLKNTAKSLSADIKALKSSLTHCEKDVAEESLKLPNIPLPCTPRGKSETDNVRVGCWGTKPEYSFQLKDHLEIAESLGLLDFERGSKIAGHGFPVWKGWGARLERALISFMLDTHTVDGGYEEILPPLLVNRAAAIGTGQLPKSEEDMYYTAKDDLFLIPTAEVPVTNLHRDEVLSYRDLPIKYTAYSPCFRREAGGHGKKTRGFLRVHQFNKVELVQIIQNHEAKSIDTLASIRDSAEKILQKLGLHYQVVELCDADLSFAAAKCFDIEVWAPAENRYLEASSCSAFLDFQARRMNLRYRDKDGKIHFCHTLNGSGLATSRVLVALLETYQTAEGGLQIPEALQPYLQTDLIRPRS